MRAKGFSILTDRSSTLWPHARVSLTSRNSTATGDFMRAKGPPTATSIAVPDGEI